MVLHVYLHHENRLKTLTCEMLCDEIDNLNLQNQRISTLISSRSVLLTSENNSKNLETDNKNEINTFDQEYDGCEILITALSDDDLDSSVIDSDEELQSSVEVSIDSLKIINMDLKTPNRPKESFNCTSQNVECEQNLNVNDKNDGNIQSKQQVFGNIAVQNSTDITFGNKTFYQGPITIKQLVVEKTKNHTLGSEITKKGLENFDKNDAVSSKGIQIIGGSELDLVCLRNKNNLLNSKTTALFAVGIFLILVVGVLYAAQIFLNRSTYKNSGDGDDSRHNIPINSTIELDNISDGNILRYVTRSEWIAQPPMNELVALKKPVNRVIIAHTATEECNTQASCTFRVRFIQTFHIESRNFDDIAYNFLVGGDGAVYEGRGWNKQGAHTKGYNVDSICIAFIGTFINTDPTSKQLKAAQLVIKQGINLGNLKSDYKLYGHRQLIPSESPGEALYKIIQTWPHWSKEL